MKIRVLLAAILTMAFTLTGADVASAAPAKCAGTAKAKAKSKACKSAPTSYANKSVAAKNKNKSDSARAGKNVRAGKGKNVRSRGKSSLTSRGKRALSRKLAAARQKRAPVQSRIADEPVFVRLDGSGRPLLSASSFYVANQKTGEVLLQKNAREVMPIASITKLMTAMVVLDSKADLDEVLTITEDDIDYLKGTHSRLAIGTSLTREEMLQLALMSSENRAASALGRNYPGGRSAFVEAMNAKANSLGMHDTRFYDTTGLTPNNVSSPRDLSRMVAAAARFPLIRAFTTTSERYMDINGRMRRFGNTNSLVKSADWQIGVSKTGYIKEAGRCLVMQAWMSGQPLVIVLMDANGRNMRTVDAQRVRLWLEERPELLAADRGAPQS
ncbi:MAG: serine hydrolase [Azoarcus sp.]|jgi:D-alanyl-D-alanine endopeptidase (penicillin-binding protein 7)|nr:serine hydrolase [Azoarcus sp.]